MKRKEFIRIVTEAMEMIETGNEEFSCNAVYFSQKEEVKTIEVDYRLVFGDNSLCLYHIKIGFGIDILEQEARKQARLNALAMYLAQSLVFKTYKEL